MSLPWMLDVLLRWPGGSLQGGWAKTACNVLMREQLSSHDILLPSARMLPATAYSQAGLTPVRRPLLRSRRG